MRWLVIVLSCLLLVETVVILLLLRRMRSSKANQPSSSDYLVKAVREIRNPLSLIKTPLEDILASPSLDAGVRTKLLIIEDNANRILASSDRILSMGNEEQSNGPDSFLKEYEGWSVRLDRMNEDVTDRTKPVVLVVENDLQFRMFISENLSRAYSVLSVPDAFEALRVLNANDVNLIICDTGIPQFSGMELCRSIKTNVNLSHIPFVLISDDNDMKSRIEGAELGADSYIAKPFSTVYLAAVIQNLLDSREQLRRKYASSPWLGVSTVAMTDADADFMMKLHEIIDRNMENQEFSIDSIADTMNMSRSSLYRKITGLTDMSPVSFLQLERLKKAAQLLKEGSHRINEISYMVGFSSSSYFSKCFQKQFGVLPKEYR